MKVTEDFYNDLNYEIQKKKEILQGSIKDLDKTKYYLYTILEKYKETINLCTSIDFEDIMIISLEKVKNVVVNFKFFLSIDLG